MKIQLIKGMGVTERDGVANLFDLVSMLLEPDHKDGVTGALTYLDYEMVGTHEVPSTMGDNLRTFATVTCADFSLYGIYTAVGGDYFYILKQKGAKPKAWVHNYTG